MWLQDTATSPKYEPVAKYSKCDHVTAEMWSSYNFKDMSQVAFKKPFVTLNGH